MSNYETKQYGLVEKMERMGFLQKGNDEELKIVIDFCNFYYHLWGKFPNEVQCMAYLGYIKYRN